MRRSSGAVVGLVDEEPERARSDEHEHVHAGEIEILHGLAPHVGRDAVRGALRRAHGEHVGGRVDPVDVDAGECEGNEEAARAAHDFEDGTVGGSCVPEPAFELGFGRGRFVEVVGLGQQAFVFRRGTLHPRTRSHARSAQSLGAWIAYSTNGPPSCVNSRTSVHPEPLHDRTRAKVVGLGERHDLRGAELAECEVEPGPADLGP